MGADVADGAAAVLLAIGAVVLATIFVVAVLVNAALLTAFGDWLRAPS